MVATDVSLLLNTVSRVTSRTLPSANVPRTTSCCQRLGSVSRRAPGRIRIDFSAGRSAGSSCRPSANQPRTARAGMLLGAKRTLPSCGTRPRRLLHHQAGVGAAAVSAAAENVAGELEVVGGGVEAAQAELEAVLARRRAVAGAGVAAADVQRRDHLAAERHRLRLVEVPDGQRGAGRLAAGLDDEGAGAVLPRRHEAGAGVGQVGGFTGEVAERRQVAHRAVGVAAGDDDLLIGTGSGERDRLRLDEQRRRLADEGGPLLRVGRDGGRGGRGGQGEEQSREQ